MSENKPYSAKRWNDNPIDFSNIIKGKRTETQVAKNREFKKQVIEALKLKREKGGKHGKQ